VKNFTFALVVLVLVTMCVPAHAENRGSILNSFNNSDYIWATVAIYQTHEWTKAQVETVKIQTTSNEKIDASDNCTRIIINAQDQGITPPTHCSSNNGGVSVNYFTGRQSRGPK
jgi:hypothetical protein